MLSASVLHVGRRLMPCLTDVPALAKGLVSASTHAGMAKRRLLALTFALFSFSATAETDNSQHRPLTKAEPPTTDVNASKTNSDQGLVKKKLDDVKVFLPDIDGVTVSDQTVTVAGQDFYRSFTFFWSDKPMSSRYAISVHEKPSARLGNLIWIEFAQRIVYQITLPPNRSAVRELGDAAAEAAYENVTEADVQRLLFQDADLGRDEF